MPALLDAAGAGPGCRVLDVAAGPGYAAGLAAQRGATVVGVDFSPDMVALATALQPGVEFREADAGALPFEDATFDAAIANFLMPHVSDLPAVVRELARVVSPGGRVALTTWDPSAADVRERDGRVDRGGRRDAAPGARARRAVVLPVPRSTRSSPRCWPPRACAIPRSSGCASRTASRTSMRS